MNANKCTTCHNHETKMATRVKEKVKKILVFLHSSHIGIFKVKKSISLNDQVTSPESIHLLFHIHVNMYRHFIISIHSTCVYYNTIRIDRKFRRWLKTVFIMNLVVLEPKIILVHNFKETKIFFVYLLLHW